MEELIKLLMQIEADSSITKEEYLDNNNELVDKASCLACGELMDNNGGCNWRAHKTLDDAGFYVFAGEKDSFGWLSGCIRTKKGIVVYG